MVGNGRGARSGRWLLSKAASPAQDDSSSAQHASPEAAPPGPLRPLYIPIIVSEAFANGAFGRMSACDATGVTPTVSVCSRRSHQPPPPTAALPADHDRQNTVHVAGCFTGYKFDTELLASIHCLRPTSTTSPAELSCPPERAPLLEVALRI